MPAIASVFVEVLPETSKIADGIRRAFREVDPVANEAGLRWKKEIEKGLQGIKTEVEVDADTSKAEAQIKEASKDQKSTVEVDADTAKANEQIKEAARDRKTKIQVDVDQSALSRLSTLINAGEFKSAQALNDLLRARSDLGRANYGDDPLGFTDAFLKAKSAEQSFARSMQGDLSSSVGQGIQSGGQAGVAALAPALMGVGVTMLAGIASALSGLAGLVPAGLVGAGGLVGTLAIGLDGVKDAYDAVNKAAQSSGQDQITKARETATAQRGLTDAVQSQAQAERDVSTAYRDAKNNLDDLNLSLQGGKISEAQAYNNVLKARRDLARGGFKDQLDLNDAQLRVASAEQQWQESRQRNVELTQKDNEAKAKGVEGSDQVTAAKERERRAAEQVTAAQESLNQATAKTSDTAKTAMQAMALLSPNAQAFVNTLMAMKPAFQEFKNSIQDALFLNIGPQFQQLATTYMPLLQSFMGGMASTMNQAFGQIAGFLQQPATMQAMQQIFANIGSSFQVWSQALQPFSEAFLKITQVGSTFLPQLAQMVVQVAQAFNQWAQSGQLGAWIQTGMTALQQLGGLVQQLLPMFMQLAPIGIATMSGLQTVFAALAPSIGPLATAFTSLITAITPLLGFIGQLVSTVITAVAPALTTWFNAMGPVIQAVAGALGPVLQQLQPILGQVASTLAGAMVQGIQTLLPVLVPFVEQAGKLLVAVMPLLPQLVNLAISALPTVQQAIATLLPFMTKWMGYLTDLAIIIIPPLTKVVEVLARAFGTQFDHIKTVVGGVWDFVRPIFEKMKSYLEILFPPLRLLGLIPDDKGGSASGAGKYIPKTGAPGSGLIPIGPPFTGLPPTALPSTGGLGQGSTGQVYSQSPWGPRPAGGANWDKIAGAEASGNWQANTGNGFFGGLQFTQSTWDANKPAGAPSRADMATPEQQKQAADNVLKSQGPGAWPATSAAHPEWFKPQTGMPSMPPAVAPSSFSNPPAGYISDAALLANVPAGKYDRKYGDDLTKGLGDCSSAVADLVNLMQGRPTTGGDMSTGTEAQWLTQRGFLPTNTPMPGTFQVGFNPEHTQATLPGGTNFNWGSDAAAAQGGRGGSGAWDPAFTSHYYLPGSNVAGMPGMPTPGVSGPPGTQQDPMYVAMTPDMLKKQQQAGPGQQLGQDIFSGILQEFGFDGSVFKDPTSFGAFKFLKSGMGVLSNFMKGGQQGQPQGGDGASLPNFTSLIPGLNISQPNMPGMPSTNVRMPDGPFGPPTGPPPGPVINGDYRPINVSPNVDPSAILAPVQAQQNSYNASTFTNSGGFPP